jgi:hypothetical protein
MSLKNSLEIFKYTFILNSSLSRDRVPINVTYRNFREIFKYSKINFINSLYGELR